MNEVLDSVIDIASGGFLDYIHSLNFHFIAALLIIFIGIKYTAFDWWTGLFKEGSKFLHIVTAITVMAFYLLLSPSIDWGDIIAIKIYIGTLLHSIITTLVIYELLLPYFTKIVKKRLSGLLNKKDSDGEK